MSRTVERFRRAYNDSRLCEAMGNTSCSNVAQAEFQHMYDLLGAERAEELIEQFRLEHG